MRFRKVICSAIQGSSSSLSDALGEVRDWTSVIASVMCCCSLESLLREEMLLDEFHVVVLGWC